MAFPACWRSVLRAATRFNAWTDTSGTMPSGIFRRNLTSMHRCPKFPRSTDGAAIRRPGAPKVLGSLGTALVLAPWIPVETALERLLTALF